MDRVTNSQTGLILVSSLARAVPPWMGKALASLAARGIAAQRNSSQVKAVRSNQWVAMGEKSSGEDLDQAVHTVFVNSARSIFEVHHYIQKPESVKQLFVFDPSFQEIVDRPKHDKRGMILAGLHMNGFDLALQWICLKWIGPMVLTLPNSKGALKLEFEIRQRTGMNLVPTSLNGLRQAVHLLQQGELVAVGIDRPVPESRIQPRFFNRQTLLPTHHIYLALKTDTPVRIVASRREKDGKYHMVASPLIEMDRYPNSTEEVLINAEKVLAVAAGLIRQTPQQWIMPHAVWPETINLAP